MAKKISIFIGFLIFNMGILAEFFTDDNTILSSKNKYLDSEKLVIFLSFSLPETTLSQYFSQGKTYHAALMIRGLVNDSFQDTQTAVMRFAKANNSGVVLDPRWFERYHITQVPAILLQDSSSASQSYAIVYGTLSVKDALTYLAEHENPVQALALRLLAITDEPS